MTSTRRPFAVRGRQSEHTPEGWYRPQPARDWHLTTYATLERAEAEAARRNADNRTPYVSFYVQDNRPDAEATQPAAGPCVRCDQRDAWHPATPAHLTPDGEQVFAVVCEADSLVDYYLAERVAGLPCALCGSEDEPACDCAAQSDAEAGQPAPVCPAWCTSEDHAREAGDVEEGTFWHRATVEGDGWSVSLSAWQPFTAEAAETVTREPHVLAHAAGHELTAGQAAALGAELLRASALLGGTTPATDLEDDGRP